MMQDDFEQIGDYIVQKNVKLGSGSYGTAYTCYKNNDKNQEYCIKIMIKSFTGDSEKVKYQKKIFNAEIQTFLKLKNDNCENLVKMIDYIDQATRLCIVMELCEYDLQKELQMLRNSNKWLSRIEMIEIIQQILKGANALINNHIIHRDIKPENILVKIINKDQYNQRKVYKIGDFGFTKYLEDVYAMSNLTRVGTQIYTAPEILEGKDFSCKCDVYSYGILFHRIVYNLNFPNNYVKKEDMINFIKYIRNNPYKCPQLQGEYGNIITDLIERMLIYNQSERLSFEDIQSHQIMKISYSIPQDSILQPIERGINEQDLQKINSLIEDEKFERLNILIDIFYRKYLLCKDFINFMKQNPIPHNFDFLILQQFIELLGFNQLNYGFAMINCIINDIEPSLLEDNDIPLLIKLLDQYMKNSQQNQAHHNLHLQLIEEYHKIQSIFKQDLNALILFQVQQKWLKNQKEFELLKQARTKKIPTIKCYELLQELANKPTITIWLSKKNNKISQQLSTITMIDTQFQIAKYRFINPDDIFQI
ncbi:unnamed protein product [Paramecium sonneborni]|uniref:Protein kinase domain-containing protein n=1 Tax=Paramecium sonneborni TaxID=65129 RepID=A0A8S1R2H4_9CILI|nr:unnamed protein product [Paramecium sonneborni]